jgi:hypothetical protein
MIIPDETKFVPIDDPKASSPKVDNPPTGPAPRARGRGNRQSE